MERPPTRATQKQVDHDTAALEQHHQAYSVTFSGPTGDFVLEDLAKFCHANDSCFDPDPRIHAALEGRRDVWLRIQERLRLTGEQLFALKAPPVIIIVKEPNDAR